MSLDFNDFQDEVRRKNIAIEKSFDPFYIDPGQPLDIEKGRRAQIGEIRTHGGVKVQKQGDGTWKPVKEGGSNKEEPKQSIHSWWNSMPSSEKKKLFEDNPKIMEGLAHIYTVGGRREGSPNVGMAILNVATGRDGKGLRWGELDKYLKKDLQELYSKHSKKQGGVISDEEAIKKLGEHDINELYNKYDEHPKFKEFERKQNSVLAKYLKNDPSDYVVTGGGGSTEKEMWKELKSSPEKFSKLIAELDSLNKKYGFSTK